MDHDKMNYIFVPPKTIEKNNIPTDSAHFVRFEIDSTDFKKENLVTKKKKTKDKKTIFKYKKMETRSKRWNKRNNRCIRRNCES